MRRALVGLVTAAAVAGHGLLVLWALPAAADHCDPADSYEQIGFPDEWGHWDLDSLAFNREGVDREIVDRETFMALIADDDVAEEEVFDGSCELNTWGALALFNDVDAWADFEAWIQSHWDDNGGQYSSAELRAWLKEHTDRNLGGGWEAVLNDSIRSKVGLPGERIGGDGPGVGTAVDIGTDPVEAVADAPASLAAAAFDAIATSVGQGAASLVGWVAGELADTGTPSQLSADWYQRHYQRMLGWSGLIMVPLAMVAIGAAVVRGDTSRIGETMLEIPAVYLLGVVAIGLVSASAGLAQTMTETLAGDVTESSESLAANVSGLLTVSGNMSAGLVLLIGLVIAIAAMATGLWLIFADAAVYGVVLFIPLAFAGRVWPNSPAAGWGRKLLTLAFALVAVKVVIFALWALTVDGLASATDAVSFTGGASGTDESVPVRSAMATAALLVLTAASPAAVLRLVPMTEGGAAGAAAAGQAARNIQTAAQEGAQVARTFGGGGGRATGQLLPVSNGTMGGGRLTHGGGDTKALATSSGSGKGGDTSPAPAPTSQRKRDTTPGQAGSPASGDASPTPKSGRPHDPVEDRSRRGQHQSPPPDPSPGHPPPGGPHRQPHDAGSGRPWAPRPRPRD